jgi:TPR repeat protein
MQTITMTDINPFTSTAEMIFELGMKYCSGTGVVQNLVEAHKWFNIAAMKGSDSAKRYRLDIAIEMTAEEIAEAQRMARAAMTLH